MKRDIYDKEFHNGANWMLDSIRGSLHAYPNGGGDIEVMKEVDRLIEQARLDEHKKLCLICRMFRTMYIKFHDIISRNSRTEYTLGCNTPLFHGWSSKYALCP